ncbi:MAG: SxtJ family membrane protein [Xanthomonadales bacterium]|nr:SxtJ family membrane protein [Xanthomonadales bacterium]
MAGQHTIPELDAKGLREFAFVTSAAVVILFGLLLPWLFGFAWPRWPWILAVLLVVWGLVAPASLQPVYRTWMRFGLLLSMITTPIIMAIVFYLIVTPTGLIRRLFGSQDPMARKLDQEESYRIPSKKAPAKNMERPF